MCVTFVCLFVCSYGAVSFCEEWHVQDADVSQLHGDGEVQVWESVSVCSRNEGVEEVLIMLFFMCNKQPNACFFFSEGI